MQELIKRLRAAAIDALATYNQQVRDGGEPPLPQWAMDTMAICKHVEALGSNRQPVISFRGRRGWCNPDPTFAKPPAPPPPPATRQVREDQYPGPLPVVSGLREFKSPTDEARDLIESFRLKHPEIANVWRMRLGKSRDKS